MNSYRKGQIGEKQAAEYLSGLGYCILAKNYRYKKLEIDIIAESPGGESIVFFEVKNWNRFGPEDIACSVNAGKCHRIKAAAEVYLCKGAAKHYQFIRFDVILFHENQLTHYEGAF